LAVDLRGIMVFPVKIKTFTV